MPAWYEWKYKTDAEPFRVSFQDRTEVDYRIRQFKAYISTNFSTILENHQHIESSVETQGNGEEYYITGESELLELKDKDTLTQKTNKVVLFTKNGRLPENIHFAKKVYSFESLRTGENNHLTEIYSEGDIVLKTNTLVDKLVYSAQSIIIENNVNIHGYARAENKISFSGPAKFRYLYASVIEFDRIQMIPQIDAIDVIGANILRAFVEKYLILPANTELVNHLVVKGQLFIAKHCKITGNIKGYQDIIIEDNTTIFGAIFCNKNIYISDNCFIQGPIVTNGTIIIGKNCFIGSSNSKTSIVAKNINIAKNSAITGQILAKSEGIYLG
jgi:predicted acyltransferase (DUF342 family)